MQRDDAWYAIRCGRATASRFADVLATIKKGEAATRKNYRAQLVCERLTGIPQNGYQSIEMKFGIENEPFARIAYEAETGNVVKEVDFVQHPEIMAGASPDGMVADDGLIEIKVPNTATHIDTMLKGVDPGHLPQLMGQLWITDRKWVDFVSYDPRMPEKHQFYCQRLWRSDDYIANLGKEVRKFLDEVDSVIAQLEDRLKKVT